MRPSVSALGGTRARTGCQIYHAASAASCSVALAKCARARATYSSRISSTARGSAPASYSNVAVVIMSRSSRSRFATAWTSDWAGCQLAVALRIRQQPLRPGARGSTSKSPRHRRLPASSPTSSHSRNASAVSSLSRAGGSAISTSPCTSCGRAAASAAATSEPKPAPTTWTSLTPRASWVCE